MSLDLTQNIRRHGFKRLLLAVSGGLDSICLAHYFIRNKESLGIEWLGIAHVHHGLREGTADRDAAFVEAFAKAHNVPFFQKRLNGEALKAAEGSLEENARDARYKALIEVFNETGDPRLRGDDNKGIIVTAHHAGDQAETMYMRLKRGTTLAGLRGIQSLRAMSNEPLTPHHPSSIINHQSKFIYRPFLNVTREELLTYARDNNLTWCEDESNSDVKFTRNFTRLKALPHLEKTYPGATAQLCRIAEFADRAYAKVIARCKAVFENAVLDGGSESAMTFTSRHSGHRAGISMTHQNKPTAAITLDKKMLNRVLREHASADLSELFRLWLSEQGLRFPIGFFYGLKEPAHVKIPHQAAYRKRSIAKIGLTVQICEFCTPEEAQKFVSCGMKEKGL